MATDFRQEIIVRVACIKGVYHYMWIFLLSTYLQNIRMYSVIYVVCSIYFYLGSL